MDSNYTNGTLNVALNLNGSGTVELNLTDPAGKSVATAQVNGNGQKSVVMDVSNPEKWTAETPNLYTLTATLKNGSNTLDFTFSSGDSVPVTVIVYDDFNEGALSPASASYDAADPADIVVLPTGGLRSNIRACALCRWE